MRTLAVTQNITIDGVIDMTEGWSVPSGDVAADETEQVAALQRLAAASDALVLGRQTFEDLRGYWPNVEDDGTGNTEHLNRVAKYVLSSTITDPGWQNSTVVSSLEEIAALKQQPGKDIVVTGSIRLTHALIDAGLVDEYRLFVFPAVVGHGRRLFEGTATLPPLSLTSSQAFPNGVVLNVYATRR